MSVPCKGDTTRWKGKLKQGQKTAFPFPLMVSPLQTSSLNPYSLPFFIPLHFACRRRPNPIHLFVPFSIAMFSGWGFNPFSILLFAVLCNGVQREHNKKLNNGLPILHKVPPKRDYGRYFCIMAEKGGTSHGGLTEKLSLFFHAKKQEVNAYGR